MKDFVLEFYKMDLYNLISQHENKGATMDMDIANTLKEFRQQHGMEQDELARLLETTQQTVSNWENGTMPRASALRRINHLLTTYKAGEGTKPLPEKPVLNPAISEIHEIRVKSEYETRRGVAEALGAVADRPVRELQSGDALIREAKSAEHAFFAALPQELSFEREARIEFQGYRTRVDYLDADVCAEFRYLPVRSVSFGPPTRFVEYGVQQLVTNRRMLEMIGQPRKIFALVMCFPTLPTHTMQFNRLITLATLHDVRLVIGQTPEQCARAFIDMIHEAEHPSDSDDFLDDKDRPW